MQICAIVNELWTIDKIQYGGRRHLDISYFLSVLVKWFISRGTLYITAKFHSSTSIDGWVIAILNYNFVMLDHPRSPFVHLKFPFKLRVDRLRTFRDIAIRKFRKFGLKCLFRPPKSCFWGVLTPKHYFLSSRPPKGPTLRGNTRFEP